MNHSWHLNLRAAVDAPKPIWNFTLVKYPELSDGQYIGENLSKSVKNLMYEGK